ncbi:hypothetical protein AB0M00_19400 [Streptomyces chartreusis]|uniref:hypothetical protein n=1 Tax=Streptomyces chartreusis TaxID=1969 RepID=UPI0034183BE4
MGDTARPIPERLGDQEAQAQHLVRTGNGPTVDNESELLAEVHGPADMAGYHTGPELADQDDVDDSEPAAEDDAPAAETAEGGESA